MTRMLSADVFGARLPDVSDGKSGQLLRDLPNELDRFGGRQRAFQQDFEVRCVLADPGIAAANQGAFAPRVEVKNVRHGAVELKQSKRSRQSWMRAGREGDHPDCQ